MSAKFTIKEIFSDHWDSFLLDYPNVRPIVDKEIRKVIDCGAYRFVPFRCHSRFCNTCGTSYQSDRANCIALKLINCKHPHVVFTIAEELRRLFRKDCSLLHVLFRSASQVMSDWFHSKNLKEHFTPGMVVTLHTFGRDLKWNPHIHMLITESAFGRFTQWKKFKYFPFIMLGKNG